MELRAENITKKFRRLSIASNPIIGVKDINISVKAGELAIIRGRSGSGKSTLLNILGGLLTPSSGKVILDDKDLYAIVDAELSIIRNKAIGFVPQGKTALSQLNIRENILLPASIYAENVVAEAKTDNLLELVGIKELSTSYPNELSGGELRRMSIARALINDPKVLLADEPTGDLDDENTAIVMSLFRDIASSGVAVLIVTHENDATKYADRLYYMNAGELSVEK